MNYTDKNGVTKKLEVGLTFKCDRSIGQTKSESLITVIEILIDGIRDIDTLYDGLDPKNFGVRSFRNLETNFKNGGYYF